MKRILALDGGGIRGIFTPGGAGARRRGVPTARGRSDLVLRDEFDFFAGTSTGAIIATALAWGMSVAEIEQLYIEQGGRMFAPAPWYAAMALEVSRPGDRVDLSAVLLRGRTAPRRCSEPTGFATTGRSSSCSS